MKKTKIVIGILILVLASLACGLYGTVSESGDHLSLVATATDDLVPPAAPPDPTTESGGEVVQQTPSVVEQGSQAASGDDPRASLEEALSNRMLSEPFRVTIQEVSNKAIVNYSVEFQPPDRFHVNIPGVVEMVVIGQKVFVLSGSLDKAPLTNIFIYAFGLLGQGEGEVSNSISDVKFAGAEMLNRKPVLVFTFNAQAQAASHASTSTNTVWIGAMNGRIYKIVSVATTGDIHSTATAQFEYDPTITVVGPHQ
jgi:hypothetical protein